jgi:hypothetical protein
MFSLLRAGLKFTQAVSDDVVKTVAADFSKSVMNISTRRWSSTGDIGAMKIAAAKFEDAGDADELSGEIESRPAWQ